MNGTAPSTSELMKGFDTLTNCTDDIVDDNEAITTVSGTYTAADGAAWKVKYYFACGDMYDVEILWQESAAAAEEQGMEYELISVDYDDDDQPIVAGVGSYTTASDAVAVIKAHAQPYMLRLTVTDEDGEIVEQVGADEWLEELVAA